MLKFSFNFILCVILIFAYSCKGKTEQQEKTEVSVGIPVFDLQGEYPEKRMTYQDIAEVEYIPLETTGKSLLSSSWLMFVDDTHIVTVEPRSETIVLFDRTGKFLRSFSHKGESGEEYQNLSGVTVDFNAKEIYVYDYRGLAPSYIQIYDFDGAYQRTLRFPSKTNLGIIDYDKDYLFAVDITLVDSRSQEDANHVPYGLISKQTGELKPYPLHVEERMGSSLLTEINEKGHEAFYTYIAFPVYSLSKSGEQVVISDFGLDTIYTCRDRQLIPLAVKQNRKTRFESVIMTEVCVLTDKSLLLCTMDKRLLTQKPYSAPDPQYLFYNRETGETFKVLLDNADGVTYEEALEMNIMHPTSANSILPDNTIRLSYNAEFLLEKYEKGELKGRLKEIASQLKADDNPVLMIARFKE